MTNVIVRIFIAEISKILIAAFKIDDVLYSLITLVTAMLHQTAYGCFLGILISFKIYQIQINFFQKVTQRHRWWNFKQKS